MPVDPLLHRQSLYLRPDPTRVVVRPFRPSVEPRDMKPNEKTRANIIVDRVLGLDTDSAKQQLIDVLENFDGRHRDLLKRFEVRAAEMEGAFWPHESFTPVQRQLVGAYFMHEYSFEAAALFNPSVVLHPDQTGIADGSKRIVISLRAVGEGHISSLTFLSGVVDQEGAITIDPTMRLASVPHIESRTDSPEGEHLVIAFNANEDISERLIFPITESQTNGIEDARFVLFEDEGVRTYYATYTAYSGKGIRSELIETTDFLTFKMTPLRGSAARNKGMALFPRKINGRFAMIARQDNENLYFLTSDDLYTWDGGTVILRPAFPWEFVQIGNCGSPIELEQGWLLITHGVGPVRRYSIGAALLNKADPTKVIARMQQPLVRPEQSEREGYVPNVVYTCGGIRHNGKIILPYAVSDTYTSFATTAIDELLDAMTPQVSAHP
jgi:predicted GH43/DUF377 family glycosyl hydrolase